MVSNDLIDLVNKEKRKQERVKTVQQLAVGEGMLVVAFLAIKILIARKARKARKMEKESL